MIYLDYSATTPVDKGVLDTYIKVTERYIGNPNSLHKLGFEAKTLIDDATKQISNILNTDKDIIYTSGASEANNLAIFGGCRKYKNRGRHIITTHLEHSSVSEAIKALEKDGYEVSYVMLNDDGSVNLTHLESLIRDDTVLVSICAVNSEIGLEQDLEKISRVLKKFPKIIFHSDVTQIIGKKKVNLAYVDLASFSAQKFYGMKGIGALLKNKNLEIEPLIYGGKSTTNYRSGTPATNLIASLAKALRLAYDDIDNRFNYVKELSCYTKAKLKRIDNLIVNNTDISIPHIINISVLGIKSETILHALEEEEIYISTKTACNKNDSLSDAVYDLTKNKEYAEHSLRISISSLTTKDELDIFIKTLEKKIDKLNRLN